MHAHACEPLLASGSVEFRAAQYCPFGRLRFRLTGGGAWGRGAKRRHTALRVMSQWLVTFDVSDARLMALGAELWAVGASHDIVAGISRCGTGDARLSRRALVVTY